MRQQRHPLRTLDVTSGGLLEGLNTLVLAISSTSDDRHEICVEVGDNDDADIDSVGESGRCRLINGGTVVRVGCESSCGLLLPFSPIASAAAAAKEMSLC